MIEALAHFFGSMITSLSVAFSIAAAMFVGHPIAIENYSTSSITARTLETTTIPIKGEVSTTTPTSTKNTEPVQISSGTKHETKNATSSKPQTSGTNITVTVPLAPPISVPPITPSFSGINGVVRSALVNILCMTQNGGPLEPISGSGVVIDPSGIIITNAHVAEYMLLKNFMTKDYIECVARTGSPARNTYRLELMYISPEWIDQNAHTIVEEDPTGTGEHDFALFRVTGSTNPDEKISFPVPSIPPDTGDPSEGQGILVAAYPAGFLGGVTVAKELYSASSISTIQKIYTFDLTNGTADLMSVADTVVAQKGSSGGAIVNSKGSLIGLIVTATEAPNTGDRELRAITLSNINRDLAQNAGTNLTNLLKGNAEAYARTFNTTIAPRLTAKLIQVLNEN